MNSSKIAVITGGGRGLGKSAALHLADRGVDVILTFREREEEAGAVVREIESKGRRGAAFPLDVGRTSSFEGFASAVREQLRVWGCDRFDFLVNNAGFTVMALFADTTESQVDELVDVHFKGTFFLTQKLLPLLTDGGRIVNMSTGLTRYTYPGQSAYAAVKGAVEVLTRYWAKELGTRGITVNAIAPGGVVTDIGGGVMRDAALQKFVAGQTPLGRIAEPDDVGGLVATLLSPEMRWVTGQRVEATGGYGL